METSSSSSHGSDVPPILRNLVQLYPPRDQLFISSSIIDFRNKKLYGPWARLAETYHADMDSVLKGLFDINVRDAFERWSTDKPIPKIAVMFVDIEREDSFIPEVTPLLVRFADATGSITASLQEKAFRKHPEIIIPNTVLVLENVPIFHRSRFSKSFIVSEACVTEIYPEFEEDRTITLGTQLTQVSQVSSLVDSTQSFEKEPEGDEPSQERHSFVIRPLSGIPSSSRHAEPSILRYNSSLNCLDDDDDDDDK